jgi:N-acetylmuramoyl-L-alanine amidase
MKKLIVPILLMASVYSLGKQTTRFYNASLFYELPSQGGRYDLFIDFCAFTRAIGQQCEDDGDQFRVSINNRILLLNPARKWAMVGSKKVSVRLMKVNGSILISVRSLIQIFQPFLARKLIYEPTSQVLHLAKAKTVSVAMASGKDKQSYFLQIRFDSYGMKPQIHRSGAYLILGFQTPFLRLDASNLEISEAIKSYNVFDHLPDKTSELHIELGPNVTNLKVEPYTADGGFIIIRFSGSFHDVVTQAEQGTHRNTGGIQRIVLDPGHGGKDEGARGPSGLKEKHVTLLLCRALKRSLEGYGYDVVLTREGDYHVPLKVRTGIANNEKADLLVSIHLNAIPMPNAWGSETYFLSPDDQFSKGSDYTVNFENQEVDDDTSDNQVTSMDDEGVNLDLILWDLAQTEFTDDSFRVARYFQEELNILAGTKNRGVKQAPLKVLQGAQMPACLVEVAFISNPSEEKKLRNPAFKSSIIKALSLAIRRYSHDVQDRNKGKMKPVVSPQPLEGEHP